MKKDNMEASDLYLLQNVPPYHLQAVAKARHLPQAQKSSLDTLSPAELGEALFDPDSCRAVIRELGELETRILNELVACGGRANSRDLALYFTSAQLLGQSKEKPVGDKPGASSQPHPGSSESPVDAVRPKREPGLQWQTPSALRPYAEAAHSSAVQYPPPHPHGLFEQALHRLLLLGLLFWGKQTNFVGRDYSNGVYDGVLIVPHAIIDAASSMLSKHPQVSQPAEARESSRALISEGALALQRSLYLYWSLVFASRDGLPLLGSRLLSRPALRQVIDQVDPTLNTELVRTEADAPRLLFLRLLLMKLELLYERNGAILAAPADAYFALPLLERARRCYRLWLETPFWNELGYLPGVVLRPGPGPLDPAHSEVIHARSMVMELVEEQALQAPGQWLSLSTFIARAKLYVPYLLFPRQYGARAERYSTGSNPYGWDFRLRHGWLTHREGWHQVEGGFIRAILSGPLRWLGLVEGKEEDRPDTFRIIPHIEEITASSTPPSEDVVWGRLVVQPNFEMIALAPVSEALLVKLDRFAERMRLEQIAQYRLTKASVTRAVQMGLRAETIQQQLEQAAGGNGAIPQNISYSVVEWERQARRIELWPRVSLLEVDDPALLDELFDDEQTRPLFGRRVAPRLAEVKAEHLDALQTLLWQRDYLPALNSAPLYNDLLASGQMPALEAQWKLLPDGLLQPCYPVVNLYLAAELERISEPDEATGWRRITPASIATSQHIPLDHIVRFLQHYCLDGVPPSLLIRLKLWGGGYDRQQVIQVEQAPMLRLSAQALRDIQADEELGPLLNAEVPYTSRLVRISPANLPRVMELLRERGFVVDE
jgi:Helicase conserved C-terminal domain